MVPSLLLSTKVKPNSSSTHLFFLSFVIFKSYNGGILSCADQFPDPSSLVYLIGWGSSNNNSYWIGVNNWGKKKITSGIEIMYRNDLGNERIL